MKLVRQVRLQFSQGTSDKVYEVDLCEVAAGRFVVNFRYGRRGGPLKDGSKTPLPVARAEADRTFDKLVESKTKKGYVDVGTGTPRPRPAAAAPPPPRVEDVDDPRHLALLRLLGDPEQAWTDLDRLIYRIGELRVPGATGTLVALLAGAPDKRAWNIVRALLRCGDATALPALFGLWEADGTAAHVRSLVGHAIVELAPPEDRERFLRRQAARIPVDVTVSDLELLYLCDRRDQLLPLLREASLLPPLWQPIRRIYKAAEARGDGEVWGLLVHRIETHRPMPRVWFNWKGEGWARGIGQVKRGDPRIGFTHQTRRYFVRRGARTLRRLGQARMAADYTAMAAGLLLAVTDDDRRAPSSTSYYDWSSRRDVVRWRHGFGHLWALNQVLHARGTRHERVDRSLSWRMRPGQDPQALATTREEAFPELWDSQPDALVLLLRKSRCAEVAAFAARAFRANRDAWHTVPTRQLLDLFGSPYPEVAELAADVAVTRYDPTRPDHELVLALAGCPHDRARTTALDWVRANPPAFLANVEFVVGFVLNPQADTRRVALEVLGATAMRPDEARIVVEAVIDRARRADPEDEDTTEMLRDAAGVLLSAFSQELKTVPLDVVTELVAHGAAGVAELGAKILLGHEIRPRDLPDELLAAVMTSAFPVVRGIGIRLYGELDDAVLAERFRVLCDLVTNRHADVRHAVRPIVGRLAKANPGFARVVVGALLPAVCQTGPEGMHADVVTLLRGELAGAASRLDADSILRLVRATEGVVQELGGDLLREHVDPASLSIAQIAELSGSDILAVRQASWAMLEARVDDARGEPDALLTLLDAPWEDSRAFGFHLVDERVGPQALSADLAIAICDSVRPDVQAFGRRTVTRMFETEAGPTYLLKLSQHPDPEMQQFASTWLGVHAAGHPERLRQLAPYFVGVMTRPNQGRIAKTRVMAFLSAEAETGLHSAAVVAQILGGLCASASVTWRAQAIETLAAIRRRFPEIETPLTERSPPLRA